MTITNGRVDRPHYPRVFPLYQIPSGRDFRRFLELEARYENPATDLSGVKMPIELDDYREKGRFIQSQGYFAVLKSSILYRYLRRESQRRGPMSPIRVLLANAHPIIRANLRQVLDRDGTCRVIGEAANGREAVFVCSYQRPDVVVLDFNLPSLSGLEAAREIAAQSFATRSIFLSDRSEQEYVSNAFQAGARGFVLSAAIQEDLALAVSVVASGNHFLSPRVVEALFSELSFAAEGHGDLCESDKRMLLLLAKGYDTAELASALSVRSDDLDANL